MQKVAKPPTGTRFFIIITTPCLSKISDWREFHFHSSPIVVPAIHDLKGITGIFFVEKFAVDVPYHVISEIVTHVQFVNPAKLGKFRKHIFVETQKIFHGLFLVNHCFTGCCCLLELRQTYRMPVDMLDQYSRGKSRSMVETTTSIRMATGTNLKVKRTIDLVFFRSVNAGQVFCHCDCWRVLLIFQWMTM
jgi:hypothetical protein